MLEAAIAAVGPLARIELVEARTADVMELPFETGAFDVVLANHMLYHLPDLDQGVTELARVLDDDGVLLAATNGSHHLDGVAELSRQVLGWSTSDFVAGRFGKENGGRRAAASFRVGRVARTPEHHGHHGPSRRGGLHHIVERRPGRCPRDAGRPAPGHRRALPLRRWRARGQDRVGVLRGQVPGERASGRTWRRLSAVLAASRRHSQDFEPWEPNELPDRPGWYPDPYADSSLRWFDGSRWTSHAVAATALQPDQADQRAGRTIGPVGPVGAQAAEQSY